MISLDGVIQAPGGPQEDSSGEFEYGGWVSPFGDEEYGQAILQQMKPADLLLGRKTFDIWEPYWPGRSDQWPGINKVTKYVLSGTRTHSDWQHVVFLKDLNAVKAVKDTAGTDIKIWGSSELVQLLLRHDLVDELWLKIHPLLLGKGKKLFGRNAFPRTFTLTDSTITSKGVILANYRRAGVVETGNAGSERSDIG